MMSVVRGPDCKLFFAEIGWCAYGAAYAKVLTIGGKNPLTKDAFDKTQFLGDRMHNIIV